jgi:hypothetical protein
MVFLGYIAICFIVAGCEVLIRKIVNTAYSELSPGEGIILRDDRLIG